MIDMSAAAIVFFLSLAVLCVSGHSAEYEALRKETEVNEKYDAILQEVSQLKEGFRQQQLEMTEIKVQSAVYLPLNVLLNITYNIYTIF